MKDVYYHRGKVFFSFSCYHNIPKSFTLGSQTDRYTQTDRQTDTHMHTHIHTALPLYSKKLRMP